MNFNLIIPVDTIGYRMDAEVYKKTLESFGKKVKILFYTEIIDPTRDMMNDMMGCVNIFIDRIMIISLVNNAINCFLINQEQFLIKEHEPLYKRHLSLFKKINYILCKTKLGLDFANFTKRPDWICKIVFIGHTSFFPKPIVPSRNTDVILHISGCHKWKGTDAVVKAWLKGGNKLPKLLITGYGDALENVKKYISGEDFTKFIRQKNVHFITSELTFEQIITLKHENIFHLQPSIAEGYGHVLMESMACGSIVLTTNAPPMNELVNDEYGFLLSVKNTSQRSNGAILYYVDEDDIIEKVNKTSKLTEEEIISMSKKSYKAYKAAKADFEENLANFANELRK